MKSRTHRIWVVVGLAVCVNGVGCARMRSYNPGTPLMLGAAAPFKKTKPTSPEGDLYAREVGRGISHSRTLQAEDRARSKARDRSNGLSDGPATRGGTAPLQVALQPPQTISPGERNIQGAEIPALAANEPKAVASPTELKDLVTAARTRLDSIATYQVTMKRQERVGGSLLPAEQALLSVRRSPMAVRLEWPEGPSKGREVLYSAGDSDGLMHVKLPDTIVPVPPLSMAVDSPMVLRNSRHPITEAGFETIVDNLVKNVGQAEAGDPSVGKISYEGLENPGQLEQASHKIARVTPAGETWHVYLDPESKLPVMVEGTALNGDLLERYLFGPPTIDPETLATVDAFDPGQRWGSSFGLLSRIARAGGGKPTTESQTQ